MLNKFRRLVSRRLVIEIAVALILVIAVAFSAKAQVSSEFKVVYSLDNRATDQEIVKLINDADQYVYFAIYYFSKENIAHALIRARQRGVKVWGITDAAASLDNNRKVVEKLRAGGIEIETQKHLDGIMHMKAVVSDKAYASGSFNWTQAATEANDEVLEIGTNKGVHDQYLSIIRKVLLKNQ